MKAAVHVAPYNKIEEEEEEVEEEEEYIYL